MWRHFSGLSLGAAALSLLAAGALAAPAAGREPEPRFRPAGPGPVESGMATPSATTPGEVVPLSNERTLTRWAFVERKGAVHTAPDPTSPVIQRLRLRTHDRTSELVVALAEVTQSDGTWVQIRFKIRPNGRTGWVKRSTLGGYKTVRTFLRIRRGKFRATLFRGGRRVWSARIGIGKSKWPTPAGIFYVRERLIPIEKNSVYGVFAFGTSATSPSLSDWPGGGIIGIHGTNQPGLIPGRISHGCIRIRNGKISKLRKLMPLGTPIQIV